MTRCWPSTWGDGCLAIALARDNNLPIIVFSLDEPGGFRGILAGRAPIQRAW
jgi:uridylate kinase